MTAISMCDGCAVFTPEERKTEIPYLAVCILLGAKIWQRHWGKRGVVGVEVSGKCREVSEIDYKIANALAEEVQKKFSLNKIVSAYDSVDLYRLAVMDFGVSLYANQVNLKKVIMLKDRTGSGYWRMVQPAMYMDRTGMKIDITSAGVNIEKLRDFIVLILNPFIL